MNNLKKHQTKATKYLFAVTILLFAFSQIKAQNDEMKRYPIESAKVIYNLKSPEGTGTKVLIFDNYGRRESVHETLKKRGKIIKDNVTILNNGKSYSIDLLTNTGIDQSQVTGASMQLITGLGGNDVSATGKKMLEGMGGEKVGSENFLGKNCEKWQVNSMGKTTMLLWEGIPLKTETRVLGIKSVEEATSIKTGVSFSNSDFEPPAGIEMENTENIMDESMQLSDEDKEKMKQLENMSYSDFKKMMKQDNPDVSEEEIKQSYEMMKKLGKILK